MTRHGSNYKVLTKRRTAFGILSILAMVLLVAAACGEDATPTPVPATATPVPPTATAVAQPTAVPTQPPTTGLRPIEEWTADNPATIEEIEAQLEKHRGESFIFTSWGGAYQEMERLAFLAPFSEKFGIEIIEDSPPDYAKVRAMARTGNLVWNLIDGSGQASITMGLEGVLEELDPRIVNKRDLFPHIRDAPWIGGGGSAFSMPLMYSLDTYPEGGPQPSSWADYLDTETFPGRRGLFGNDWNWKHMVRYAHIAKDPSLLDTEESRATLSAMSPEELDQAWKIVEEEMLPVTDILFAGGSDCPSLLQSGELDICETDNGVAYDAITNGGLNADVCWECGHDVLTDNWWMPKGIKEQDPNLYELLNLFLAWTQQPAIAASQALYQPYGPTNLKSAEILAGPEYDAIRAWLPTSPENAPFAILMDEASDGLIGGAQADKWFAVQGKK